MDTGHHRDTPVLVRVQTWVERVGAGLARGQRGRAAVPLDHRHRAHARGHRVARVVPGYSVQDLILSLMLCLVWIAYQATAASSSTGAEGT